jgi:hypothetical protein
MEALSWEDPSSQLETIPTATVQSTSLPLIVHIISQRTQNNQAVNAALIKAWEFTNPFSFAVIGPNNFLLKFSKQEHIDKIYKQVTWNVNGYLLTLQNWSPSATTGEVSTQKFPFWIQIHALPLENTSLRNAIAIGKGMGNLIKVDDVAAQDRSIFRSYLRVLVEIDVHAPQKPGFLFHRGNGESAWISQKYERLDIYYTNCGCIGHKKRDCCVPLEECFPSKYDISLKVNIFSNLSPSAGERGFVATTSSLSQLSSAYTSPKEVVQSTGIIHDPHKDVTISHLTPTILAPLKHLSLQPKTSPAF